MVIDTSPKPLISRASSSGVTISHWLPKVSVEAPVATVVNVSCAILPVTSIAVESLPKNEVVILIQPSSLFSSVTKIGSFCESTKISP